MALSWENPPLGCRPIWESQFEFVVDGGPGGAQRTDHVTAINHHRGKGTNHARTKLKMLMMDCTVCNPGGVHPECFQPISSPSPCDD